MGINTSQLKSVQWLVYGLKGTRQFR